MKESLRGINLGGWLVAERWMTPALFEGVQGDGERALVKELGRATAKRRLKQHRDTFITEKDFEWIAHAGFSFVRLPVGYWLIEPDEYFVLGQEYVDRAFDWAERHGLRVILDFHGLQGSQNGQDHSGQVGPVRLYRSHHRAASLATLQRLCELYGRREALLGLELINEPKLVWGWWGWWRLLRYYRQAIPVALKHLRPETKLIVSDAFKPRRMARALARMGYGSRIALDVHLYQLFTSHDQAMSYEAHLDKVQTEWLPLLRELKDSCDVLVGEWSAALPARADSRANGTTYYAAQQRSFDESVWAHCYWSYRAPGAGAWSYRDRVDFHNGHL